MSKAKKVCIVGGIYIAVCLGFATFNIVYAYQITQRTDVAVVAMSHFPLIRGVNAQTDYPQERDRFEQSNTDEITRVDKHLDYTDERINQLADKVATMQGVGVGAMFVLAFLQAISLVFHLQRKPA